MNDPTFLDAARAMAAKLVEMESAVERLQVGFQMATGRLPSKRETSILNTSIKNHLAHFQQHPAEVTQLLQIPKHLGKREETIELATYTVFSSMLLNLDEVISKQ